MDWFDSHFVGDPEDRFSRGEAHLSELLTEEALILLQFTVTFSKMASVLHLGLVLRKPVFRVSIKASFKPVSSDTGTS